MTNETKLAAKFTVGDKVRRIAFVDAFGAQIEAVEGLTVTRVRFVDPTLGCRRDTIKPYYRVLAHGDGGFGSVEGAERFFELA